jgi:hypothetical protein
MQIFDPIPGNDIGIYVQPSPEVKTVKSGDCYVNAAYDGGHELLEPPRTPGKVHVNGTCGGYAGLCGCCFDLELSWHIKVAKRIAVVTPPKLGENYYDYTVRVRGRMLDTWPQAFGAVCK